MSPAADRSRRPLRRIAVRARSRVLGRAVLAARRAPAARPVPAPADAPILVLGHGRGFGRHLDEVLRTEGLTFRTIEPRELTPTALSGRSAVVVASRTVLDDRAWAALETWVRGGGRLVLLRPEPGPATRFGFAPRPGPAAGTIELAPRSGVASPLRFHGPADLLDGGEAIAWTRGSRRSEALVSLRTVGRGVVAAFGFDVASSVVLTRQGDPARAQGPRSEPPRATDLLRGAAADGAPWVDASTIAVPQADELQRLLTNAVVGAFDDAPPVPRFAYLPEDVSAAVVLTGDDHGNGDVGGRFRGLSSLEPDASLPAAWRRPRTTSYAWLSTTMDHTAARRWVADGHEVSLHVTTRCRGFDAVDLAYQFEAQFRVWRRRYPALPGPATLRTHCVAWDGWAIVPSVARRFGVRLETSYYHYPAEWLGRLAGYVTGSALPMRFADRSGETIDVLQLATQVTDESGQSHPQTLEALLDASSGPAGFPGFLVVNAHTDPGPGVVLCDAVVASARTRGVPVVSARQVLDWWTARESSSIGSRVSGDGELTLTVRATAGAGGLTLLVPARWGDGAVERIECGGREVTFDVVAFKGTDLARVPATTGTYLVRYGSASGAAAASGGGVAVAAGERPDA